MDIQLLVYYRFLYFSGNWFGFGNTKKAEVDDDTINVFSLASGHLYERLLKIMMLSVMKNTKWVLVDFSLSLAMSGLLSI